MSDDRPALAGHVEQAVEALAALHREHYSSAPPLQRGIDHITDLLGRPTFAVLLIGAAAAWTAGVLLTGGDVHDAAFAWLELAATMAALFVAVLILVTQRREDQLAERRAQLTLELALLSDVKNAKIISLLEELRRDDPNLTDRDDRESAEMTTPEDPGKVLKAIDEKASSDG